MVADVSGGCGPGCTISVRRTWTATGVSNIALDLAGATGTPGANTLNGVITNCSSVATATVTLTLRVSCTGGAGTVFSECQRTETCTWPAGCGDPGAGTPVSTTCPDSDGISC